MIHLYLKFSILVLAIVVLSSCASIKEKDNERTVVLKSFIKDISNYERHDSIRVRETYFMLIKNSQDSLIFNHLIPLSKMDILSKDLNKFSYVEYKNVKKSEQNIFIESGMNEDDIYVIKYNKTPYMFILFSQKKIKSFVTLNKGTYRYFMPL